MSAIKSILIAIAVVILFVVQFFIVREFFPRTEIINRQIIPDSTVQVRYETETKRDTVIKWYEKIIYKTVEPTEIRVQSVDTIFKQGVARLDIVLKGEKDGSTFRVYAFNEDNMKIKEYIFENVGRDFTFNSVTNNVILKTQKVTFDGFYLNAGAHSFIPANETATLQGFKKNFDYSAGVGLGYTIYNNINFDFNTSYLIKEQNLKFNLIGKYYFR